MRLITIKYLNRLTALISTIRTRFKYDKAFHKNRGRELMKNKRCSRSTPGIQDTCSPESRSCYVLFMLHLCLLYPWATLSLPSPARTFSKLWKMFLEHYSGVETAIIITRCSWRCLPCYALGCRFPNTGNPLAPAGSRSTVKIKILEIMKDYLAGSQVKKVRIRCFTVSSFLMCFTE